MTLNNLFMKAVAIGCCVVSFALDISAGDKPDALDVSRYEKAEKFLAWNKGELVLNGDISHYWIGDSDSFWYRHEKAAGAAEFVVVDARNGKRTSAFDHAALATILSTDSGEHVEADKLPFSFITLDARASTVRFTAFEQEWICAVSGTTCKASDIVKTEGSVSPDGKWRVFAKDHNLFIIPASGGVARALTTDGVLNNAYGSTSDSSMMSVTNLRQGVKMPVSVLWSPDSRRILTYRLDESKVKPLHLLQSVPEDGSFRPKLFTYRYAMPGDKHKSLFHPVVFDVETGVRADVDIPHMRAMLPLQNLDYSRWSADGKTLHIVSYHKGYNTVGLYRVDAQTGATKLVIEETSDTLTKVSHRNIGNPMYHILENGDFIWFSERDGYGHLYLYDGVTGKVKNRITQGNWVVRELVHVDNKGWVYFLASGRDQSMDPHFRQVFRIKINGENLKLLTPEKLDHLIRVADYLARFTKNNSDPSFSPSGKYFVDSFSSPAEPSKAVVRKANGTLVTNVVEENVTALTNLGYTPVEPFSAIAADGETTVYGNIFRPSNFDPSKQYAIIDSIYPGPQMNRTSKRFDDTVFGMFGAQAIAELGFIVITVDGRGNPERSKVFFDHSYEQMGKAGFLEDHIATIRQLAERYSYMDINRVGIYGHSGGGYASAHAMFLYPDFFKVAVSDAGNHDQRGYAALWGETYNGDPAKTENYMAASNPPFVEGLKGKLLLVHGDMDDNVHPALTMQVVDALIKANKDFDMLILPNQSHSYTTAAAYFKRKRWDYFVTHLMGKTPPVYKIASPE